VLPHDRHRPRRSAGKAACEMTGHARPIRHLDTHRNLVSRTEQRESDAGLTLDAIVVPASRTAENLEQAITLARALDCVLLILCSHAVKTADVHDLLARRSFSGAIVISLPDDYRHDLLDFPALAKIKEDLPQACSLYVTDLSMKRNVGLVLARMLGWRRIFFLDDDIRDINPADVQSTVSMLGSHPVAGMRVSRFPDNSAACHAHRETGGLQDVFITGAALAVDCEQDIGFFPDIYNEDWLFFFDNASRGQLGGSGREVTQLRYDPFADPERAAWQEFGDVLAEGLYTLLDRDRKVEHATSEYWSYFLTARQRFLEAIIHRSDSAKPQVKEKLLSSVEAALKCSITIEPRLLERYVRLWRHDLRDWQRRIAKVGRMSSLEVALKELGLEASAGDGDAYAYRAYSVPEEPPTMPYKLVDLYDLLETRAEADRRRLPGTGRRGGGNRRASILPHHGSPGVQEGGRLASALRSFQISGRGCPPATPSPEPDAASGAAM
jgi:hypothetical protein